MSTTAAQPIADVLSERYKESYAVASSATSTASTLHGIVIVGCALAIMAGGVSLIADQDSSGWVLIGSAVVLWITMSVVTAILRVLAHALRALCDIARLGQFESGQGR
jgi:hypothetical protein